MFMKTLSVVAPVIAIFALGACGGSSAVIDPGDDPNFTIVANEDGILSSANRKVEVFGVPIYAVPRVDDKRLLHAANVMAQYLDNDEDGVVDNQRVVDEMIESRAFMIMWARRIDTLRLSPPDGYTGQDLGDEETNPDYVSSGLTGRFDASLEEVLHIITHAGYARAYPEIFGESEGSAIADAMDIARGGRFMSIPSPYPDSAWYTYDDSTCDYSCMITEYHYWALTSLLGAQANRLSEIDNEWRLNTATKLEERDSAVYELLTNPEYVFPRNLPDGTYMR